jgi:predicted Fe-S protein YdhL (DUF1289 family)
MISANSDSPCVRCCCLDNNDVCLGCFRTLEEIVSWSTLDASRKEIIKAELAKRRQQKVPLSGQKEGN